MEKEAQVFTFDSRHYMHWDISQSPCFLAFQEITSTDEPEACTFPINAMAFALPAFAAFKK